MIAERSEGRARILTLDRPDKANALTAEMLGMLSDAVERANRDEGVNALILTGAGKVFSAGADLEAVRAGLATDPAWERLSSAVASSPVPTIAALNGTAAGGALGMVLACDVRVSAPGASLFYPVIKMGVLPQPSDPARLMALVGPARARLILLCGTKMDADEALSAGLLDRISDDPLATALDLAAAACASERVAVMRLKAIL